MEKPLALVIEDHADQALVFKVALETAGYRTEMLKDGALAQLRLEEVTPALILLDLHLPNVSGQELLQEIKANPRFARTRVVVATANPGMMAEVKDQVDLALHKPVGFTQLTILAEQLAPRGVD